MLKLVVSNLILILLTYVTFCLILFHLGRINVANEKVRKTHLAISNYTAGTSLILILLLPFTWKLKIFSFIWKLSLLSMTLYYWKKNHINRFIFLIPLTLGLVLFMFIVGEMSGLAG